MTTSVTGNAQAFGYSITITVTYGMVNNVQHNPTTVDLLLFALAGVLTFSAANLLLAALAPTIDKDAEPARVVLVATATDILAVSGGVGAAAAVSHLTGGWVSWVLAPLLAGLVYILVQSVELAVGWRHATTTR
jgi:hypothetical protein